MDEEAIKKIISSGPGRRLLNCLLLVQPITINEMKQMIKLSLDIFNPTVSMKREFPNVSNIELDEIHPGFKKEFESHLIDKTKLSKDLFTHADLYDQNRILKKAIASGLVIEKKVNKSNKDISYFFLNSDLYFIPDRKKGIQITNYHKSYLYKYKHERIITNIGHPNKIEHINERIALAIETDKVKEGMHLFPINELLTFLWWMIKHPKLIYKTIEKYKKIILDEMDTRSFTREDLPPDWRSATHLIKMAIKTKLFTENGKKLNLNYMLKQMAHGEIFFNFCRSYEILRCFDNFDDHLSEMNKKSPMEMLNILTLKKYNIDPAKRPLFFTSIMYSPFEYKKIYKKHDRNIEESHTFTEIISNENIASAILVHDSEIINYCPELKKCRLFLIPHFNSRIF